MIFYPYWLKKGPFPPPPEPQKCRVCGCSDLNCAACIERTGAPCRWVEPDLCSACAAAPMTCADAAAQLPQIGAIVQLKSGGQFMTVVYSDLDEIGVSWFCDRGHLHSEDFPPDCLSTVKHDDVPF